MYALITVLIIIVCILIMAVVLVQNPKGGGLGAGFGGAASNIMGVQKTGDILEKATWYLIVGLLVLSLTSAFFIDRNKGNINPETNLTDTDIAPISNPVPEGVPTFGE